MSGSSLLAGLQIAFFRQLLKLSGRISPWPHVIFAELAPAPWQADLVGSDLGLHAQAGQHGLCMTMYINEGSLHPDVLSDNIHDALGNPGCCN